MISVDAPTALRRVGLIVNSAAGRGGSANLAAAADAMRARTGMARSGEDEVNYKTVAALADKVLEPDVQAAAIDVGGQLTAEQLVPYACARPMSLSIYAGGRGRIVRS